MKLTTFEPVKILIFDVDGEGCLAMVERLESEGFRTQVAGECLELLSHARQGHFDLVIVETEFAELMQTDLPRTIRLINCAHALPMLWLTDSADAEDTASAIELGVDLVLRRDSPYAVLRAYIEALARKTRRMGELFGSIEQLKGQLRDHRQTLDRVQDDNRQLRRQSFIDPLTRVYNARYMEQWLKQSFAYARRYHNELSVMLVDIDHFKSINDAYGHLSGDRALIEVATVLQRAVRDSDLVARYGGDELVLALPDTPGKSLPMLAERVLGQLRRRPIESDGQMHILTCSMGAVTYPVNRSIESHKNLIALADEALYAAKKAGRGRLIRWEDTQGDETGTPLVLSIDADERSE